LPLVTNRACLQRPAVELLASFAMRLRRRNIQEFVATSKLLLTMGR
jgi:hypothetical protein